MVEHISLVVNGQPREGDVEPRRMLVQFLREDLELTGTHVGCDTSQCGACTVHVDGKAVKSCTMLAVQADGANVTTIEGMQAARRRAPSAPGRPSGRSTASSAGSARPGMIMAAADLLARNADPTDDEIRHAIEGNICRCTGYHNIVAAIREAAVDDARRAPTAADARRRQRLSRRRGEHAMATDVQDVLGSSVKRVEDPRFITGKGRYLDDIKLTGMTHLAILRSPYAHANIRSIDTSAAKTMPGVLAVIVGADIPYNPLPMAWPAGGSSGHPEQRQHAPRSSRRTRVKWTGEGVAAVVAETPEQAVDALEAIEVDYEPLPAVVDAEKATQPGAPQLHDNAPNNVVFDWTVGDKDGHREGASTRPRSSSSSASSTIA